MEEKDNAKTMAKIKAERDLEILKKYHKKEKYLKELKKVMTDPGRDPGPLDDWGSFEVL